VALRAPAPGRFFQPPRKIAPAGHRLPRWAQRACSTCGAPRSRPAKPGPGWSRRIVARAPVFVRSRDHALQRARELTRRIWSSAAPFGARSELCGGSRERTNAGPLACRAQARAPTASSMRRGQPGLGFAVTALERPVRHRLRVYRHSGKTAARCTTAVPAPPSASRPSRRPSRSAPARTSRRVPARLVRTSRRALPLRLRSRPTTWLAGSSTANRRA
jgi:hypothetical protein